MLPIFYSGSPELLSQDMVVVADTYSDSGKLRLSRCRQRQHLSTLQTPVAYDFHKPENLGAVWRAPYTLIPKGLPSFVMGPSDNLKYMDSIESVWNIKVDDLFDFATSSVHEDSGYLDHCSNTVPRYRSIKSDCEIFPPRHFVSLPGTSTTLRRESLYRCIRARIMRIARMKPASYHRFDMMIRRIQQRSDQPNVPVSVYLLLTVG